MKNKNLYNSIFDFINDLSQSLEGQSTFNQKNIFVSGNMNQNNTNRGMVNQPNRNGKSVIPASVRQGYANQSNGSQRNGNQENANQNIDNQCYGTETYRSQMGGIQNKDDQCIGAQTYGNQMSSSQNNDNQYNGNQSGSNIANQGNVSAPGASQSNPDSKQKEVVVRLQQAVVMSEILSKPVCKTRRARRCR